MRRVVSLLLVLGLMLSLATAGVMAAKGGPFQGPPPSAGEGQYCNAGNGNGNEIPAENNPNQVECDPGNSPENNQDNDRENESDRPNPPPKK